MGRIRSCGFLRIFTYTVHGLLGQVKVKECPSKDLSPSHGQEKLLGVIPFLLVEHSNLYPYFQFLYIRRFFPLFLMSQFNRQKSYYFVLQLFGHFLLYLKKYLTVQKKKHLKKVRQVSGQSYFFLSQRRLIKMCLQNCQQLTISRIYIEKLRK